MTEELPSSELGTKEYWKDIDFDIWTASAVGDIDHLCSMTDISRTETHSEPLKPNAQSNSKSEHLRDLNSRNSGGWTCLMYAAYYDHANVARWLLEGNMHNEYRGPNKRLPANPSLKSKFGKTPLMLAASCGHNESVETILDCCKTTLSPKDFSVHLEETDHNGFTALFHAASNGHCSTCMIILEYGSNVDVNENCRGGYTPLIWAAAEGHDRVVEVLISFGADINYRTINGETAMSVAHRCKRHNVVARLSVNLNTKLIGLATDTHAKSTPSHCIPKAVIHYESEKTITNKSKIGIDRTRALEKFELPYNSLADLLKELGLEKYHENFCNANVKDIEKFKTLTDEDLKDKIGISLLGPRRKLTTAIHCLRAYTTENENFDKDGLEGEVWFGEESTDRIMRWLQRNNDLIPTTYSILDLGCGNGQAAFAFRDEGYNDITGVDYSESAIELSNKIARKCNAESIIFKKCDILSNISEIQQLLGRNSFDVCFDKGTYDAISLCPEEAKLKRQKYIENISELLKSPNSKKYLILTSCNWTKEELVEQLKEKFDVRAVIPTPQFKFGGVVGNNVTSVIFERKL